jgi:hypothetical protein
VPPFAPSMAARDGPAAGGGDGLAGRPRYASLENDSPPLDEPVDRKRPSGGGERNGLEPLPAAMGSEVYTRARVRGRGAEDCEGGR